jgi:hypothetical protein
MRLEPTGQVPGRLPQRLVAQTRIIALPLAPKGAESAPSLPQEVVAVDDQAIHAVVSGLDQVRRIGGKGIRRSHTAGLAQFQQRAKHLFLIPDKRYYGETTPGPARDTGAVSEGIAGDLMTVIWQPQHKGFSASHWHPGTSVADDVRRLDCAKSLLGVQIRIPGSASSLLKQGSF